MEQFGNVSCHHHSYIWHHEQNKTNVHLHVSIFLAEFSGLYFFLCLCLSVAHFFVQWFSLCFFFVFTFIFIFVVCFCCLFVCVSHTGDAEIKPRQGGIRYKTYLYQPCHACCCYLNKKKIGAFMKCHIHLLANISIRDMANYSLALGIVTFYPA